MLPTPGLVSSDKGTAGYISGTVSLFMDHAALFGAVATLVIDSLGAQFFSDAV